MNASTTDTFTCTSTTGKALTGLKPLEHVTLATVQGWGSDFAGTDASNAATGWHYNWYGQELRRHRVAQRQVDPGDRHVLITTT